MRKFILIGISNASEGRELDYGSWYESTHMADICALPGVKSGRRFEATPFGLTPPPGQFLAIYEVETDDIQAVMNELRRRSATGEISMTDSIDFASSQLWIYEDASSAST